MGGWSLARLRVVLAFALLALVLLPILLQSDGDYDPAVSSSAVKDFYWIDIVPSHELVWHPCYNSSRRQCARLLVPLDHLNHSNENASHATIALIRVPSPSLSTPHYRGPVLINPGGPGGSGVNAVNQAGDIFAQIIGEEFDIVGFDPRGVARSTPKVTFFDGGGFGSGEREVWGDSRGVIRRGFDGGLEGESGRSLEKTWARAVVMNKLVGERAGDSDWLGNINTEQTAYDMLSIVKAYGREKLQYWGFSYGTILGSTFAALFPDKVERMVLDGVADAADHYAAQWNTNLLNTSDALNQFFTSCHTAGPTSCPFWAPSPSLISTNLTRIYHDIITNPIPIIHSSASYGILDYSFIRQAVFTALYTPYTTWPALAAALAALGGPNRDPTLMWKLNQQETFTCSCPTASCNDKNQREKDFVTPLPDATTAILCTDGEPILAPDLSSSKKYFSDFVARSEWAEIWANNHISCTNWPKTRKMFRGPIEGITSFPILFVGNTADPVAPLEHAKMMSRRFPGSRVLTQNSSGHCSITSPSVCTQSHIRTYFRSGILLDEDTICPVTIPPFPHKVSEENGNEGGDKVGDDSDGEKSEVGFGTGGSNLMGTLDDFGGGHEESGEMVVVVVVDEEMRDAVIELSKVWRPFRRPLLGWIL